MTTETYAYPKEGRPTIIVDRPQLTERTAHILGRYFRQEAPRASTGTPQVRPREIPRPFPDTRPVAPAQTSSTSDYVATQQTLRRRNFMADNEHGGGHGHGGGSGAAFANWASGILASVVAVVLVIVVLNAIFSTRVAITYVPSGSVVTTADTPYVVTPGNQACKPFLVEMKSNGAAIWSVPDGCPR